MTWKIRWSWRKLISFISENYFWIMLVGFLLAMTSRRISTGVYIGGILTVAMICCVKQFRLAVDPFAAYLLINILSAIWYIMQDMPIILYIKGLMYVILPMSFYFIKKYDVARAYKLMFDALFASIIIGIILYLWAPEFYADYLYYHGHIGTNNVNWIWPNKVQSLYGITALSTIAVCCAAYFYWQANQGVKGAFVKMIISFFVVIYNMRRGALVAAVFIVFFETFVMIKRGKRPQRLMIIVLSSLIFFSLFCLVFRNQTSNLVVRLMGMGEEYARRSSGNWDFLLKQMRGNLMLGNGVGSMGHSAIEYNHLLQSGGVYDGNYTLIIAESGIVGFGLFIWGIVDSFIKFIRNKNRNDISVFIVIIFMLVAVGSNVWEFPLIAPLFWYSLSVMRMKSNSKVMD